MDKLNINVENQVVKEEYAVYQGDSTEVLKGIPSNVIDYIIFSPPFSDLYIFSNNKRDLSNVSSDKEFFNQFRFMVDEMYRTLKPGRLLSFHIINLPTSKFKDGFTGLKDFRGDTIRLFQESGFIYHSEVCIWKDPGIQMQRTKAQGLLHKQVVKDSSMSRQALADYLVTMRKPGENTEPIAGGFTHFAGDEENQPISKNEPEKGRLNAFSIDVWNRYASPVWFDINPSRTLQRASNRNEKDEKHMTPTQLDVIERALQLWSNEGDVVLTPFGGIGSEGYQSLKMGRKAILCELKKEYFEQIPKNMEMALQERQNSRGLFD